jgi:hypothetical protein
VQSNVGEAAKNMSSLAYSTIGDDQECFTRLISFRSVLGRCYDELGESSDFVQDCVVVSTTILKALGVRWPSRGVLQDAENLQSPLYDRQAEVEKRLYAIKTGLDDEIQIVVSTVQVREAQVMEDLATVTARHATYTAAPTVLAAVYLPMKLVTGVFGMKIKEIRSEATAPNASCAVIACVVVVVPMVVAPYYTRLSVSRELGRRSQTWRIATPSHARVWALPNQLKSKESAKCQLCQFPSALVVSWAKMEG